MTEPTHDSIPSMPKKLDSPRGLLPRNTQAWVIGGISLLMVLVIAFSGRSSPKERRAPVPPAAVDTNAQRIEEYKKRIDEEAQKLQTEKAHLARTQSILGSGPALTAQQVPTSPVVPYAFRYSAGNSTPEEPLLAERQKREYLSLFASNVALTYRPNPTQAAIAPTPVSPDSVAKALAAYAALTSVQPLSQAEPNAMPVEPKTSSAAEASKQRDSEMDRSVGPRYRLFEGTMFETVLTNRLDGSFSGPVNCMVTTDVYSHNGLHLLIPQGSRVLGEVRRIETFGESRLAVTFHKLVMPDGYSVSLDQFHGLNQIGETGLKDQVNHHYMPVFGASLAIGSIAGLSQANTSYGVSESAADAYRQGAATSLSQSSLKILDRYLNVLPTVTIREGHRVKIYLSGDLLVPAYENHRMEDNL